MFGFKRTRTVDDVLKSVKNNIRELEDIREKNTENAEMIHGEVRRLLEMSDAALDEADRADALKVLLQLDHVSLSY